MSTDPLTFRDHLAGACLAVLIFLGPPALGAVLGI